VLVSPNQDGKMVCDDRRTKQTTTTTTESDNPEQKNVKSFFLLSY
jgi:hypothetical protein